MDAAATLTKTSGPSLRPPRTPSVPSPETARLGDLISRAILEPLVRVELADERRRLRLIAGITATNVVLDIAGALQTTASGTAEITAVVAPILLVTAVSTLLAHALARFGHVVSAATLLILAQLTTPLLIGVIMPRGLVDPRSTGAWLSLAVVLASVTFGKRGILLTGAAAALATLGILPRVGGSLGPVCEAAFFLAAMTTLVFVHRSHHDGLEQDRQATLRRRNGELEQLRLTLEDRVVERTRDLQESTSELVHSSGELACANATLRTSQALLVQTEKMAAVGRLTAGIAHELASPLGATLSAVEDLGALGLEYQRSIGDPSVSSEDHRAIAEDLLEGIALARVATLRAVKFVRGIRAYTRDPGPEATESFELFAVVTEAVELLAHASRAANVTVRVERPSASVRVVAVPSRMNQVVTNLVKNGVDAIGAASKRGVVTLRMRREADQAVLEVEDDGPGIAADVLPRIFEPLFTTKAYGQGTGLGLSIVRAIVQSELHGAVEARSTVGAGATFVVQFPLNDGGAHGA